MLSGSKTPRFDIEDLARNSFREAYRATQMNLRLTTCQESFRICPWRLSWCSRVWSYRYHPLITSDSRLQEMAIYLTWSDLGSDWVHDPRSQINLGSGIRDPRSEIDRRLKNNSRIIPNLGHFYTVWGTIQCCSLQCVPVWFDNVWENVS